MAIVPAKTPSQPYRVALSISFLINKEKKYRQVTASPLGTIHALLVKVYARYELSDGELFKSRLRAIAG